MNDNINDKTNTGAENGDNLTATEQTEATETATQEPHHAELPVEDHFAAIEKLNAEINEMKDKHIRLIAEFDNFRRRTANEKIELEKTAAKSVIQSLLVVLDDMHRAEKQLTSTEDITAIREGVLLVFNKMRTIMQSKGLKAMDAVNQEFNADLHEAITEIPAPNDAMKGKIIDMVEAGYYLNDRLIRYAKVVVGN